MNLEDLKDRIVWLLERDDTLDYRDISDRLEVDLQAVVAACRELEREGMLEAVSRRNFAIFGDVVEPKNETRPRRYKIVPFPNLAAGSVVVDAEEKELNELASDGWRVVVVIGECVIMERS